MVQDKKAAAAASHHCCCKFMWTTSIVLVSVLSWISSIANTAGAAFVGMDYGTNGDNLPTPQKAVLLLQKLGITEVRIYDTNPTILQAFSSTTSNNISVAVGVPNELLLTLGESPAAATQWVTSTILPAMAAMANITAIAVGSETLTKDITLWPVLVPAMANIHAALTANLLDTKIKVSSPCSTDLLMSTFPPSNGAFNSTFVVPVILPLLQFLSKTNSFFMLNVNTFHIFQQNSQTLTVDYALFRPNPGVMDSTSGLRYFNLFDAVVDAVFYAIAALNHSELPVVVTSTGWPTQGDPNEVGASVTNAQVYNGNLVKRVLTNVGTPAKPSSVINTYLNGLFDEDKNAGPVSERSWGLFNADQTPKYAVDLVGQGVPDISGFNGTAVYKTWCVAKQGPSDSKLQLALDYACGQADCSAIQAGQSCWMPNSVTAHASYAMNSYYQKNLENAATCDFNGLATITTIDPSYGNCIYGPSNPIIVTPAQSHTSRSGHTEHCAHAALFLIAAASTWTMLGWA